VSLPALPSIRIVRYKQEKWVYLMWAFPQIQKDCSEEDGSKCSVHPELDPGTEKGHQQRN
jgi:hypothetical protein